MVYHSILPERIKEIFSSPDKALEGLDGKVKKSVQSHEETQSGAYKRALDRLDKNQKDPDKRPKRNLRSISKVLSAESISPADKALALKVLNRVNEQDISEWVKDNPEMGKFVSRALINKPEENLGNEKFKRMHIPVVF